MLRGGSESNPGRAAALRDQCALASHVQRARGPRRVLPWPDFHVAADCERVSDPDRGGYRSLGGRLVLFARGTTGLGRNRAIIDFGFASALVELQKTISVILSGLCLDIFLAMAFIGRDVQENASRQDAIGLNAIEDIFGALVPRNIKAFPVFAYSTNPHDRFMRAMRRQRLDAGDLTAHLLRLPIKEQPLAAPRRVILESW
jgi:hypothetical protein